MKKFDDFLAECTMIDYPVVIETVETLENLYINEKFEDELI